MFSKFLLTLDYPNLELRLDPLPKRPDEAVTVAALSTPETKPVQPGAENAEPEEPVVHDRYVAPEMKNWTPVFRNGHDLLIPVALSKTTKEKLFIVDTGAASMLISPDAAREVTKVDSEDNIHIKGISGEVNKVYTTRKFTYYFAHLGQEVDGMVAIDTTKISHDVGTEVSGFLGAPHPVSADPAYRLPGQLDAL